MVPCFGRFWRFSDVDEALFSRDLMVKATHGSGWNMAVPANDSDARGQAALKTKKWLRSVYGSRKSEWAYRDLKPSLIVEPLLKDAEGCGPLDFKVYCFGGECRYVMPEDNRGPVTRFSVYDRAFELQEMSWEGVEPLQLREDPRVEEMIVLAERALRCNQKCNLFPLYERI